MPPLKKIVVYLLFFIPMMLLAQNSDNFSVNGSTSDAGNSYPGYNIYLTDTQGIEHIWIMEDDILFYQTKDLRVMGRVGTEIKHLHHIRLKKDSIPNITKRSFAANGFTVKLNQETIYTGKFELVYKNEIAIYSPTILCYEDGLPVMDNDEVLIWYFGRKRDPRNNSEVFHHFREKKLFFDDILLTFIKYNDFPTQKATDTVTSEKFLQIDGEKILFTDSLIYNYLYHFCEKSFRDSFPKELQLPNVRRLIILYKDGERTYMLSYDDKRMEVNGKAVPFNNDIYDYVEKMIPKKAINCDTFIFKNDTIVQTLIANISDNKQDLNFTYEACNTKNKTKVSISGIAKLRPEGDAELDEDNHGEAYLVNVYDYWEDCYLSIRMDYSTSSKITIVSGGCDVANALNSIGVLTKQH